MRAFYSVEACEIVGILLLWRFKYILIATSVVCTEMMVLSAYVTSTHKKQIALENNILKDPGLNIALNINAKVINSLDATFDLSKLI